MPFDIINVLANDINDSIYFYLVEQRFTFSILLVFLSVVAFFFLTNSVRPCLAGWLAAPNALVPFLRLNFVLFSVSALYELWCCNICRCIKLCENSTNFSPVGCRCCWSCCCCSWCCWCRCLCGCWVCDAGEFMLDKHLAKLIFAIWREEPLPKNASSHREKEIKEKRKNIAWIIRIVGFTKKFFFCFFSH